MSDISEEQIRRIVRETTREAMAEFFESVGHDISTFEGRDRLHEDFAFIARQRKGSEQVATWAKRSAIMAVVSGVLYVLWEGFRLLAKGVGQ